MKIVLDTNVLISALIVKKGKPGQILRQITKYKLVTSEEILVEVERVLHYDRIQKRYGLSNKDTNAFMQRLREVSQIIPVTTSVEIIKDDPDDNKFLACALAADADYIISGDTHLTKLGDYQGVSILTPATFLEILAKDAN